MKRHIRSGIRSILMIFLCLGLTFSAVPRVTGEEPVSDGEKVVSEIEQIVSDLENYLNNGTANGYKMAEETAQPAEAPSAQAVPAADDNVWKDAGYQPLTDADLDKAAATVKPAGKPAAAMAPESGTAKAPVASADIQRSTVRQGKEDVPYWDVPVEKQNLKNLREGNVIDEAYREAKSIKLPQPVMSDEPAEKEEEPVIMTDRQIIQKVIKPEFRDKPIDLEFTDANLGDILLALGSAGELNIVLDPELRNNQFDLFLKDVTLEEALMLISDAYSLGFKEVGTSLYITTKEKLRDENMTSRLIKLRNLSVQEAKALVEGMVASVSVSEEINSLVVIDQPDVVVKVEELLRKVDGPQPQVVLEAKIIELNKDALRDLGVDWSDQILVNYQETDRPVDFDDPETSARSTFEIAKLQRNALQFSMTLKMLENQNKAKVLATPKITTLNNKEAEIFVGDRVPYTVTTVSGGVATTDVRFEEPGIRLKITPSIIDKEFVVIKVEPEVSFIFTFRGPASEYPQTRIRKATAFVRVKNQEPFVLGGLLNQEDKKNLFKVPIIGNLPLLGNLFSYEKDTVIDTELIITIVPTIVYGEI